MYAKLCVLLLWSFEYSHGLISSETSAFNNGVVVDTASNATYYLITASGLPAHSTQKVNPNSATDQDHSFWIKKSPTFAAKSSCLPMGSIAISINGVPLFNPLTIEGHNAVEGANKEIFDSCYGHPTNRGTYHYHQLPICLYNGTADEFIGVAFDGFPIYGPNATDLGREVTNSDLDECHGRNSTLNGVQAYRYYITRQYPYILGCFKGDVPRQSGVQMIDSTIVCSPTATACNCLNTKSSGATYTVANFLMVSLLLVLASCVSYTA